MKNEVHDSYDVKNDIKSDTHGSGMRHGPGPELMGAGTLMGDRVCNINEEDLGYIKEIMLDTRDGRVRYVVLSVGSFLGMGDKLFAVPWDALTLDTKNKRFVLSVEKDRLENAPGFNKDKWPNMSDSIWAKEIHAYYGAGQDSDRPRV